MKNNESLEMREGKSKGRGSLEISISITTLSVSKKALVGGKMLGLRYLIEREKPVMRSER
jgi:hypothetical protein